MIFSVNAEKLFNKIQYISFCDKKKLVKLQIEENYLYLTKGIYKKILLLTLYMTTY